MTKKIKYTLNWNGKNYVSFDDDYISQSDISKNINNLVVCEPSLGSRLANYSGRYRVEDKLTNYSYFITLSFKNVVDVKDTTPYYKLIAWARANDVITEGLFTFEYYNDKENIHCHGIFNSGMNGKTKQKIKSQLRKRLSKVYGKEMPTCSIDLKKITEYQNPNVDITLGYIKKDIEFMKKHNIHPLIVSPQGQVEWK